MTKFTYKNISNNELELMGFGVVEKGGVITTDTAVDNPNFKLQGEVENESQPVVNEPIFAVQEVQPNVVTEAEPITNMEIN